MTTRPPRLDVAGVLVSSTDYEEATGVIIDAARSDRYLAATALAVHGVMSGHDDPDQRARLNSFDLVAPDGQPVRWALNHLHRTALSDRVYGPQLMLDVCAAAAADDLPIFLYGSTQDVVDRLAGNLSQQFPSLRIAGTKPSLFRTVDLDEQRTIAAEIEASGARICFVGLGCPRQEVFVYEHRDLLSMPVVAVGAAFDFHAGNVAQAPRWMQDRGLEWLFRLVLEPRRLWRRYVVLNPRFMAAVCRQRLGLRAGTSASAPSTSPERIGWA